MDDDHIDKVRFSSYFMARMTEDMKKKKEKQKKQKLNLINSTAVAKSWSNFKGTWNPNNDYNWNPSNPQKSPQTRLKWRKYKARSKIKFPGFFPFCCSPLILLILFKLKKLVFNLSLGHVLLFCQFHVLSNTNNDNNNSICAKKRELEICHSIINDIPGWVYLAIRIYCILT